MLILADADGLGLDLDQLRQRVLQAAGNRGSATQGNVEIGELLGRQLGGGIDRGAGFRHHHLGQLQLRHLGDELGHQLVGLAAGRAIADAHQLDLVPHGKRGECSQRPLPVRAWLVRVDRRRLNQLACRINHRHLDAGPEARIEPHRHPRTRGCGQQQVLQVLREHTDGLGVRALLEPAEQIDIETDGDPRLPGEAHGLRQPGVGGAALVGEAECDLDLGFRRMGLFLAHRHIEIELQNLIVLAAQQRQRAMRRERADLLAEIEIVGELGAVGLLALDDRRGDDALAPHPFAQTANETRVLAKALDQDCAGAVQRGLGIGDAFAGINVFAGLGRRIEHRVTEQGIRQRLQPRLAGDLRLGAPLRACRAHKGLPAPPSSQPPQWPHQAQASFCLAR